MVLLESLMSIRRESTSTNVPNYVIPIKGIVNSLRFKRFIEDESVTT